MYVMYMNIHDMCMYSVPAYNLENRTVYVHSLYTGLRKANRELLLNFYMYMLWRTTLLPTKAPVIAWGMSEAILLVLHYRGPREDSKYVCFDVLVSLNVPKLFVV